MHGPTVDSNAVSISVVATGATLTEAVEKLKASVAQYEAAVPTAILAAITNVAAPEPAPTRGRPEGSTNKPKETPPAAPAQEQTTPEPADTKGAPAPATTDAKVTKDDAIAALQLVMKANADPSAGMADVRTVLAGFTGADGKKVAKIGDVKPEDYAAVKAAAEKFLADKA